MIVRYANLLFQAFKLALWFVFCVGLIVLLGGSFLLGLVIAAGVAFVVLLPRTIVWNPVEPPPGSSSHVVLPEDRQPTPDVSFPPAYTPPDDELR